MPSISRRSGRGRFAVRCIAPLARGSSHELSTAGGRVWGTGRGGEAAQVGGRRCVLHRRWSGGLRCKPGSVMILPCLPGMSPLLRRIHRRRLVCPPRRGRAGRLGSSSGGRRDGWRTGSIRCSAAGAYTDGVARGRAGDVSPAGDQAAAQFGHPEIHVLCDYEAGGEEGEPYVVYVLVEGGRTLAQWAQAFGPLPPPLVSLLGCALGRILQAMHEDGFVHTRPHAGSLAGRSQVARSARAGGVVVGGAVGLGGGR